MKTNKKSDRVKFVQLVQKHLGLPDKGDLDFLEWIVKTKTSRLEITLPRNEEEHKNIYSVYCRYLDSIPKNANNQWSGKHNFLLMPCYHIDAFNNFVQFLNDSINETKP